MYLVIFFKTGKTFGATVLFIRDIKFVSVGFRLQYKSGGGRAFIRDFYR